MSLLVPVDIEPSVRAFVATGQFQNEAEVLRAAMVALKRQEQAAPAILEGIEDESAGRLTPARKVVEAAKHRLA
jgi:Arc/MetJ-type ribon-helix-helix transcriptional regulator